MLLALQLNNLLESSNDLNVVCSTAVIEVSGSTASIQRGTNRAIAASTAALVVTGNAATVNRSRSVVCGMASIGVSGSAASINRSRIAVCGTAAITLSGTAAYVARGVQSPASEFVVVGKTRNKYFRSLPDNKSILMAVFRKQTSEVAKLTWDFSRELETLWRAGVVYSTSTFVRPVLANGYEYECTTAGQSDSAEPSWPTTVGDTVTDGSAIWTCRTYDTNATDTISSATVTSDADITIGTPTSENGAVSALVSGGDGTHSVLFKIVTAAGETIAKTITVVVE